MNERFSGERGDRNDRERPRRAQDGAASGGRSRDGRGPSTERSGKPAAGRGRPSEVFGRGSRSDVGAERPDWQKRVERKREDRDKSPMIPEEITPKDLDMGVRIQLKTLTAENAEMVARHLAMAALLINDDAELAHKHALAASQRAGRIAVVRETVGVTAYRTGDFALALRELLSARRISGSNEQIALIVDCERGLGRPDRALEIGRSIDRATLPAESRVNLAIAMSGARLDRNENELALAELEIPELNPSKVFDYSPPLFWAYAEALRAVRRDSDAKSWDDLGDRALVALERAANPDEVFEVLEEIEIPRAYESKRGTGDRGDRDRGDRDRGDRRDRDGGNRQQRSDRPRTEIRRGGDRGGRDTSGESSAGSANRDHDRSRTSQGRTSEGRRSDGRSSDKRPGWKSRDGQ